MSAGATAELQHSYAAFHTVRQIHQPHTALGTKAARSAGKVKAGQGLAKMVGYGAPSKTAGAGQATGWITFGRLLTCRQAASSGVPASAFTAPDPVLPDYPLGIIQLSFFMDNDTLY